jgi:hypothetical protein
MNQSCVARVASFREVRLAETTSLSEKLQGWLPSDQFVLHQEDREASMRLTFVASVLLS